MRRNHHGSSQPSPDMRAALRTSRRALMGAAGAGMLAVVGQGVPGALAQTGQTQAGSPGGVAIYPARGTWTASPHTEISFRGITAVDLGDVVVVASASGGHSGILSEHADGNGVSFLPDARFEPGEIVTVEADGLEDAHRFGVVQPVPLVPAPESRVEDAPEVEPQSFQSRPDLMPPTITITDDSPNVAEGYVFLTSNQTDGQIGPTIVDDAGEIVWFEPASVETESLYEFRVQEYQGQPVLTWAEAASPRGFGFGHFVIADSSYQRIVEFQTGNGLPGGDVHEFLLTPRGTALVIIYHPVEWDVTPVEGSRYGRVLDNIVQEVEIETGRVLFEWHSLDHVAIDESQQPFNAGSDLPYDYFHMNSVEEDANGDIIISARHTFAIYKIDRQTSEVAWRLNGTQSDFAMGEGTQFAWQHDARIQENGQLTLFDNAESNQDLADETWSRGLVLDLDEEAMTATLVQEYVHPAEILSTSQANMQVLPNGNVFIGWGSAPVFSEFTADGELIFNGRFPQGSQSYRAYRFPWVGEPTERPAIAVSAAGGSAMTVYASWNGATEVVSWRVLAGPAPTQLFEVGSGERTGFETAIDVETDAAYLAVEALDGNGNILGASEAVQPGE